MNDLSFKLLVASHLPGIGPATLREIAEHEQLESLSLDRLGEASVRMRKALTPAALATASDAALRQLDEAHRVGGRIVTRVDADYPNALRSVRDAPGVLYILGALAAINLPAAAVVGTREPTASGREISRRLAAALTAADACVISGLAAGCDTAAHKGVLEAGGTTVAVLAHGLDAVTPPENADLAAQILEGGGALISEYGWGVEPAPFRYAARDRIQAALAAMVFLVQSGMDGGSLIACRAAVRYRRPLYVVPSVPADRAQPSVAANLTLIEGEDAAKCALLECASEDLRNVLPLESKADYPAVFSRLHEVHSKFSIAR